MTPDRHSVFRHHTPSEKDIRQQKIQTLPLSTKNRSTKALSTKEIGGICQACINAAATKTPAITPQILHPANPLIVSRDEKQNKRQEAVARATQLYNPSVGNPSTVIPLNQSQLSFGGRPFRAIASAAISTSSSLPQNLDSIPQIIGPAYDSTRTARVASFDPYPTSQASWATAKRSKAPAPPKPPANKAIAASTITGESTTTQESTTSKSQIESHTTKVKIPTPENIPRARTTRSQNAEGAIPPMDLTNLLGED
ncbi:hypothetical protein H4Q26_001365 [Puccinia striiformis f. sp. tritici PST-130]|nr:hypothetical protein H4Q26_001365 [Puccinia striiformis f. sp. tritici PST-130]